MEDKRLGRVTGGNESFPATQTTKSAVIGPADNRITIRFYPSATQDTYISSLPNAAATDGIKLTAGSAGIELKIEHFGSLVQRAWFAATPGGASNMTILEGLLDRQ